MQILFLAARTQDCPAETVFSTRMHTRIWANHFPAACQSVPFVGPYAADVSPSPPACRCFPGCTAGAKPNPHPFAHCTSRNFSVERDAAIDIDGLTGHGTGLLRAKKKCGARNFLRGLGTALKKSTQEAGQL